MQSLQYTRLPWSTLARSPLAHSTLTYMLERKAHQDFTFWIVQCDLFTVRCVAHCVYHIVLYISLCNACVCVFLEAMACNVHTVESLQLIPVKLCFRWLAQKTEWEKKRWRINREMSFTRAQVTSADKGLIQHISLFLITHQLCYWLSAHRLQVVVPGEVRGHRHVAGSEVISLGVTVTVKICPNTSQVNIHN